MLSSRTESNAAFSLAELYASNGDYQALQAHLGQVDQSFWSEPEIISLNEFQALYLMLQSNIEDSTNYVQLSPTDIGALQSFQENLESPQVWQKVNSLLEAYEGSFTSYTEPVYLSANAKKAFFNKRQEKPQLNFMLFPNPAKDYVEVRWDWFLSGLKDPISIHVYAMDGKQVLEFEHEDFTSNVALLNTSSLLPGVYQLSIRTKFGEALHQQKLSILK